MYKRKSDTHTVLWYPEDEQTAKEAVENVVGEVDEHPVEVNVETAESIHEEYTKLTDGPE